MDLAKKLSPAEQVKLRELLTDVVPAHAGRLLAPFEATPTLHGLLDHLLVTSAAAVDATTGHAVEVRREEVRRACAALTVNSAPGARTRCGSFRC